MSIGHLARRFFGSLDKRPLPQDDIAWVRSQLLPAEYDLWRRYSFPDRRHTIAVARDVERQLGEGAARPVIAAALLHDIGKIATQLGTIERVVATLVGGRLPADHRFRRYLDHNETGGELLAAAGSDPVTVAWAVEHELPRSHWSLPPDITDALWAADNR